MNSRRKFFVYLLLITVLTTGCLGGSSSSTYSVSGKVVDSQNNGVSGVFITRSDSSSHAITDADGKWSLSNLKKTVTLTPFKEAEEENQAWVFTPKSIEVSKASKQVNFTATLITLHDLGEEVEIDPVSNTVHYKGGIALDFSNIVIPQGTRVTVREVEKSEIPEIGDLTLAGNILAIEFSDPSLDFSGGVVLTMPLNEGASEDNIGIFHRVGSEWIYQPSTLQDGVITATVTSFSLYGVFEAERLNPPTASRPSGVVEKGEIIQLTANSTNTTIYYGSDLEAWPHGFVAYQEPFTMPQDELVFYAVAIAPNRINSDFVLFEYLTPEHRLKDSIASAKKTIEGIKQVNDLPAAWIAHSLAIGEVLEDLEFDPAISLEHLFANLMPLFTGFFFEEPNHHYFVDNFFDVFSSYGPLEPEPGYAKWGVTMMIYDYESDELEEIEMKFKTNELEMFTQVVAELQALMEESGMFLPLSQPQGDLNFFFESEYIGKYGSYTVDGYVSILGPTINSNTLLLEITDLWLVASINADGEAINIDGYLRPEVEMVDGVPVFTGLTFDGSISSGMLSFQGSLEMQDLPESMPRIIIEGMLNVASIFSISLGNIELGFVEETYYDEYWDEYYSYLEFRELIVRNAGYFAPEYGVEIALNSLAWLVDSADISAEIDTNVVFGEFEFLFAGKLKASYDENLDQIAVTISDVRVEQSGYPTLVSKWIYITIGDEITGDLEFTTDEGILLTLTLEVDEWDSFALEGEFTTEAGDELATMIFDPVEEVLEVHYIDETTDYIVFEPIGMY